MSFAFAHVVLTPATAPLPAPVPVYRGLDMDTAVDKTMSPREMWKLVITEYYVQRASIVHRTYN